MMILENAGISLKTQHMAELLESRPALGFLEVHAENYMGEGGRPHRDLAAIREHYPLSIHGVGLSLGGAAELSQDHLSRLAALVRRYEPILVSEHLAWSSFEGAYLDDLLPTPYTDAALQRICDHVDQLQCMLGRRVLVENPSTYVRFEEDIYDEAEFISEITNRTGCGLLLDVNNVYVSAVNHAFDPQAYLAAIPMNRVEEIHLAGHSPRLDAKGAAFIVDSHDRPIAEPVWDLYRRAIALCGAAPTLIERDANIPPWPELFAEATRAGGYLASVSRGADLVSVR